MTFSSTAEIRVLYPRRRLWSNYKSAHVLVSGRIYWKEAKKGPTNQPQSLLDFRNTNSLELVRLRDGSWKDVDEMVLVDNHDGRPRITVRGQLRGHTRRKKLYLVRDVRLEIIPCESEQLDVWVQRMRARIAPWSLLQQQVRDAANRGPSSGVEDIGKCIAGLVASTDEIKEWGDNLVHLPEQMQKLSIIDELIAHGTAAVETGAALTKLVTSVERVVETAEFIADASKCVAGVSTVFHLVALSAQGVSMCAEANRGRRVLPVALGRIVILLRYVLESLAEIMKPSRSVNELDKDFVLNVLKQLVCTMDVAETQLLRGQGGQIMNAEDVKEVERKIEELEPLVVIANNASRICAVDEKVNLSEEGREISFDGPHHVRPSVSAFFSGRKKELKTLKDILQKRGSAVITQYGGVGKTELMTAFADLAERDEQVPGGVFWVTVDGDVKDVIGSLAGLAENLTKRKMSDDERRNVNLVIAALEQGLGERQGRWLLCLDNADNGEVRGILNEVCGIAGPLRSNGWIVVTSRQGQPHIWDRMKSEQKLALEPLCGEDAMVALWRQIWKIERGDADDDEVMAEINKLEVADQIEYCALKKLCGDDGGDGLGGLPLALVQAGSFIAQFKYSFADYLNLFESTNKEDWQDAMSKTEEPKSIRESQKSVWTTWKISVQKLSEKALIVLRAMAMLGQGGIEEATVRGILKSAFVDGGGSVERTFRNVIVKELMHGSSLIWHDTGEGGERCMYMMHRLVRRFILSSMVCGSEVWNHVYSLALLAVHECVRTEFEKEGKSFYELPDVFEDKHREFAAHSLALVRHHMPHKPGNVMQHRSEVEDIHRYSGKVMKFIGKWEEEVQVWEHLLGIYLLQEEEDRRRGSVERLLNMWRSRNRGKEVKIRIASTYDSLGVAVMRIGKLNQAASKLEESLEMRRAIHRHSKPHSDIATSLNNLGEVYHQMGKLDKALEKHEESLELRRAIHGNASPHPDIAISLSNLGSIYWQMGKLDKAMEKHVESLEMFRAIHGQHKPHPDIAKSLSNLGSVYLQMGKLDEALRKDEQSLEMRRAIHGNNRPHPDIAASLNNLGEVYRLMRELDKALEKHKESLKMRRAIHGRSNPHPDIAKSLDNLGIVYCEMDKLDKSLEKHEESLKMFRAIHGNANPHPAIASSLHNLGHVYHRMGILDKALQFYEQCLEIDRAIHGHGENHHDIAMSLNNLGVVYWQMGYLDEALEKLEESLEMKRAIHGHSQPHLEVARSLNNLGEVYRQMSELDKVLEKDEQSLEMHQAIHGHGEQHPDIAASLKNLGVE